MMENKKNNVLLTVIGVATLLVAIVGASFAYFSASGGTATQNVKTGSLKISAVAGAVNEANIKPVNVDENTSMADKLGDSDISADIVKLPITINTTGTTISGEYNMYLTTEGIELNTAAGEGGSLSDIKWELVKEGADTAMASGNFSTGDVTKLPLNTTAIPVPSETTDDVTTYGGTENYNLLIYIKNTNDSSEGAGDGVQDQLQGLQITAFVTVEAIQTPNK